MTERGRDAAAPSRHQFVIDQLGVQRSERRRRSLLGWLVLPSALGGSRRRWGREGLAPRRPFERVGEATEPANEVTESGGDPRVLVRSLLKWATVGQPEQRLMLAVLEDALLLVVGRPAVSGGSRLVAEARAWVAGGDWSQPFSFQNVCEALDLDAARVRALLAPWVISARSHTHQPLQRGAEEPALFVCAAPSA